MLDSYRGSMSPQMNASRDYARQRQMGIGDLLLENRIVFLDGPIHDASANLIVMKLLFLQSENKHQEILLQEGEKIIGFVSRQHDPSGVWHCDF